jgi:hypothetical protein
VALAIDGVPAETYSLRKEEGRWTIKTRNDSFDAYTVPRVAHAANHVLLVRVEEDHLQRQTLWTLQGKATVVRSFKGTWTPGETVTFEEYPEIPSNETPNGPLSNQMSGQLYFFFVNTHTNGPIGLDTGDEWPYDPAIEARLASRKP